MQYFNDSKETVVILGLGFVGAAMAAVVSDAKDEDGLRRYNVIGIDVPSESGKKRAESINKGVFPFETSDEKLKAAVAASHKAGNLIAVTEAGGLKYADIVIVDINLDVLYHEDGEPYIDLSDFKNAIKEIGEQIRENTLVIIETTVPPGTCEKIVSPILSEEFAKRGLNTDKLRIAHSYERVMPGKDYFNSIANYWRVYSGIDDDSADRCESFLKTIINTKEYPLTRLKGTNATEIAKVLENSYRAVNIAFINEWGRFAEEIGVDLFEVVDAIRMRPTHSNMRTPAFGVGGYCLTKDPFFGMLAAKELFHLSDMEFFYSTNAIKTNTNMPMVVIEKLERWLGGLKDKRILLCGVSYKSDVADTRYSPSEIFVQKAEERGARVDCQDPMVDYWEEMNRDIRKNITDMKGYDAVVFAVPHKQYREIDFSSFEIDEGTILFDTFDVLSKAQRNYLETNNKFSLRYIGR